MTTAKPTGKTEFGTPSDTEVTMSRVLDAPRRLVFEAFTNPEHLPHWMLGPDGWTMPICEIDLRPGGKWHFGWRNVNGEGMEMTGEYREVSPPDRLVRTESWGPEWPETLCTLVLTDADDDPGRTLLVDTISYPSKEARDAALATGMNDGADRSFDLLADYLRKLLD
ncbi:SRPBCC family protein [Pseudonocardia eucalypti]|uniref:SRPBCC family protein n=1 Tax=Pseudonocardia eucalypti TaxID=648755 RepID=A0ABP9QZ67_9PSEU|nr:uncharacterized protein YndB with AHSA1/START domain [Pseudonocardia eucalypti]